jgi:hypothetical protein
MTEFTAGNKNKKHQHKQKHKHYQYESSGEAIRSELQTVRAIFQQDSANKFSACVVCGVLYSGELAQGVAQQQGTDWVGKEWHLNRTDVCLCGPVSYHTQCLAKTIRATPVCDKCDAQFRVAFVAQYACLPDRLKSSLKYLGLFLYGLAVLAGFLFLFAPQDWIALARGTLTDFSSALLTLRTPPFLLMMVMQVPTIAILIDTFYVILFLLLHVFGVACVGAMIYRKEPLYEAVQDYLTRRRHGMLVKRYSMLLLPVALAVVVCAYHLLGNVHYQFYCAVGAINVPAYCEWAMGWQTCLASGAGFLLLSFLPALAWLVVWLHRRCICIARCCCCERVLVLKPTTNM